MTIPSCIRQQVASLAIKNFAAASYAYYEAAKPFMSDSEFDELCIWIRENKEWILPYDLNNYVGGMVHDDANSGFEIASKVCGLTLEYAKSRIKDLK